MRYRKHCLPLRVEVGEASRGRLVSKFERCFVRVGIPYPAPASGLKTSPKRGCRVWPARFLSRDGVVEGPLRDDWSRLLVNFGVENVEEGVARDEECWSNCLTRSLIRPGRVGTVGVLEARLGLEDTGFDADRKVVRGRVEEGEGAGFVVEPFTLVGFFLGAIEW